MDAYDVVLRGVSPLLMHRFPSEPIEAMEKKTAAEQAELAAYRDGNGALYVPGHAMQRALVSAAAYSKGKGRGSLSRAAAACLLVEPAELDLATKKYVIDSRPVVVPATKGRIVRHRPRLDEWTVRFRLHYDPTLIDAVQLRRIVDDAGSRVGLLDFRPEKKGPFGRFQVTSWEPAE